MQPRFHHVFLCFVYGPFVLHDREAVKEKWPSYLINKGADCGILVLFRSVV